MATAATAAHITTLHLRAETDPLEQRSALSPPTAKALLEAGYHVHIEHSRRRIYGDKAFQEVGARIVAEGSWVTAPADHIIIGLNQLPSEPHLLRHTHIHFGNCYNRQDGWSDYLGRFVDGGGKLYDLECLTDDAGRRVVSFSYWAGFAGAATALLAWSHQLLHPAVLLRPLSPLRYPWALCLAEDVSSSVSVAIERNSYPPPQVVVLGANTLCGMGALGLCRAVCIIPPQFILERDVNEVLTGGPFSEIPTSDVLINCLDLCPRFYPPVLEERTLSHPGRTLSVISDPTSGCGILTCPYSPIDVDVEQSEYSGLNQPSTVSIPLGGDGPPLTVVNYDPLPNLVARDASNDFSLQLLPALLTLNKRETEPVWTRAEQKFQDVVKLLLWSQNVRATRTGHL
ncbi:hypothetical protein V8F06_012343 [Rhypophila decipiens]